MELTLENGDCLELMKKLPDKSVDLFICDLPYAETNCKWDIAIDMVQFWAEFKRLRKSPKTACIHFCSTKFGYQLIKSWEKGFKMDMVWKKRNKTGGLQSRHRPMRNHEMVYFFYDQAPKYNRDKYHKRIEAKPAIEKSETAVMGKEPVCKSNFEKVKYFDPPNPASVLEADGTELYGHKDNKSANGWDKSASAFYNKDKKIEPSFDPKLPASVLEEKEKPKKNKKKTIPLKDRKAMGEQSGIYPKENQISTAFDPPNPASVLEEKTTYGIDKKVAEKSGRKDFKGIGTNNAFDPKLPASVLEENSILETTDDNYKERMKLKHMNSSGYAKQMGNWNGVGCYTPLQPCSVVVEEYIEPAEDEPWSMFESTKVFIGKRNHQTEKPLDILEFFLKYWTNDNDTILDPTMGSGSTGVACKNIGNRKFIGYEMNETIFKVAQKRCGVESL